MTIKVTLPSNPLTQMARDQKSPPKYAETKESDALLKVLQRYWKQEINGYTTLVSGHRGAGKTTLVYMILDQARRSRRNWGEENYKWVNENILPGKRKDLLYDRELLPVYVDAPSLFGPLGKKPRKKKAPIDQGASPDKTKNADINGDDETPVELFLKNLMAAFYRDLTGHVTSRAIKSDVIQDRELANHLSIDMDRAPDADLLRDYWRRFDGLRYGLFFNHSDARPKDQPFRELSAICTAAQAYQKVIGDLEDKRSRKDNRKHEQASTPPVQPLEVHIGNGKEKKEQSASVSRLLTAGFFGFLSGGTVLVSELSAVEPSFYFTVAGTTLLAASIGYGLSSMFSKTSRERQDGVQKDLSLHTDLGSLSRDLPALLQRTRLAGLYPVFVIDEMDKLENVREDINNVISHIKRLLADNGVFIFLCDRAYFEYLEVSDMEGKHLPEATFFQHRLFIAYRPVEIFNQLLEVFARHYPGSSNEDILGKNDDPFHLELLTAILITMRRGRMHQSEMSRELYKLPDKRGLIDLRSRFYEDTNGIELTTELFIQLAILCAIEETPYIAAKMRESTLFTQQVYDAAYYPLRLREMNQLEFEITTEALSDHFRSREELGCITEKEIADLKKAGVISDEIVQDLSECIELQVTKNGCNDIIERVRRKNLYGSQKNSFSNIRLLERLSHNVARNLSNPNLILYSDGKSDSVAMIWLKRYCQNDGVKEKIGEEAISQLVRRLQDQFEGKPLITRTKGESNLSYRWNYWDETISSVDTSEQTNKDVEKEIAQGTAGADDTAYRSNISNHHVETIQKSSTLIRLENAVQNLKANLELCDIIEGSLANIRLLGRYGYLPVNYSAKRIKDSQTLIEEVMSGNRGINLTEYDRYLEEVQKPNFLDTTEISETLLSSYEELTNAIIDVETCNALMLSQRKNLMGHFLIASVLETFINRADLEDRTSPFWRAFEICGEVLGLPERQDLNNSELVLDPMYKQLRSLFKLTEFFRRGASWETRKWATSTLKQVNEIREKLKQGMR